MTFVINTFYGNPHDEETYSKSIEFTVMESTYSFEITSITNPPNKDKIIEKLDLEISGEVILILLLMKIIMHMLNVALFGLKMSLIH